MKFIFVATVYSNQKLLPQNNCNNSRKYLIFRFGTVEEVIESNEDLFITVNSAAIVTEVEYCRGW